jgi:hypothetical protein
MTAYVGRPLRRREDFRFLTGKGRYVDDIKLANTLHLAILRSPHAHAIITGVDLSAAKAAAGVRLALAGADLPRKIGSIKPNWVIPGTMVPDRPVIAIDRVRFVGECVALVVAETREAAYDALELIDVVYESLPAIVDEVAAIADGAPQLHENVPNNITTYFKTGGGDYAAAARQADQVLRLRLVSQQPAHSDLPRDARYSRGAWGRWRTDGLSAQSGAAHAPPLDRGNSWYSGAPIARGRARYRWRLWRKNAPLSRGAALCLAGPRAEISGQVVGIAVGKPPGDEPWPRPYGNDRSGLSQ